MPFRGADLDDAEDRNRRSRGQLVEHDVRRIGGDRDEVHTSRRQPAERRQQVLDQPRSVLVDEVQSAPDIETIDHDGGSTRRVRLRAGVQNTPVVVDCGLRPQSTDQAECLHPSCPLIRPCPSVIRPWCCPVEAVRSWPLVMVSGAMNKEKSPVRLWILAGANFSRSNPYDRWTR